MEIVKHVIDLTDQEVADLLSAIEDARAELCLAPGMVESAEIDQRWAKIARRLKEALE